MRTKEYLLAMKHFGPWFVHTVCTSLSSHYNVTISQTSTNTNCCAELLGDLTLTQRETYKWYKYTPDRNTSMYCSVLHPPKLFIQAHGSTRHAFASHNY